MTTKPHTSAPAPYWTWGGLFEGAWRSVPLIPGTIVFSMVFGTIAAQKGLTLTDTVLMNAIVFAGSAQFVAIEVWKNPLTLGTILSLATITAIVNARFILMSTRTGSSPAATAARAAAMYRSISARAWRYG
jgi:predicted branched-subunit amino acid permease